LSSGENFYIGRQLITDGDKQVLVISWTSPLGKRYYTVDPADPQDITRKREFHCTGNTINSYADVLFEALTRELVAQAGAAAEAAVTGAGEGEAGAAGEIRFSDALLAELERERGPELRDIVATIHATQYELISAPLEEVLVVDGGPGTGKTVVTLHRVAWLLANHPDRVTPEQVLVVGPNQTFVSYTELVLPSLGTVTVDQQEIGALAPRVRRGRPEPDELARLKGDIRMAGLLARALDARIGTPEAVERIAISGGYLVLAGDEVSRAVAAARMADLPYAQRRERLRATLRAMVEQRLGGVLPAGRVPSLDALLGRLWPSLTAPALLADLFNSRRRLAAAGTGHFTDLEVAALHRRAADRISREVWSEADLALLDEAEALINGRPTRTYAHIAVDEAQDLSPMQLRSVARRCATGSMTLAGDLAQATGPTAARSWAEVLEHLPARTPARVVPLRYGYRVPREVYEFAAQLLPVIAPEGVAPHPIRSGQAKPEVHKVAAEQRAAEAAQVA
ncbi:MAG TPA: UvrD-helicase domain-containing protein, partial [Rugosimonospora sp.]|nr:UvrD-helicase domain-containing protein [Rugosimonospora sp.]